MLGKIHILLILLSLLILPFSSIITGSIDNNNIFPNQISFTVTPNTSILNLNYTTDFNLTVEISGVSDPTGAYFEIVGISYDIGEAQIDYGNGTYILMFQSTATQSVAPGNYSVELITLLNETEESISLTINISTTDTTAPTLTLLEPTLSELVNSTLVKLVLMVTDDVEWRDINVTVGDVNLIYYQKTLSSYNISSIKYNQTYLYYERWIDFSVLTDLSINTLIITARDWSFNSDSISSSLTGDYTSPQISISSHTNRETITTRTITLIWEVLDTSPIQSQRLLLDGKEFLRSPISGTDRSVTFTLPIDPEEPTSLDLTIIVEDAYGNNGELSLTLLYSPGLEEEGGLFSGSSTGQTIMYAVSGILLVIASIGGALWYINKETDIDVPILGSDYSDDVKGIIMGYNTERIDQLNSKVYDDAKLESYIEELWIRIQSIKSLPDRSTIQNELQELKGLIEHIQDNLDIDQIESLRDELTAIGDWVDNISEEMKNE